MAVGDVDAVGVGEGEPLLGDGGDGLAGAGEDNLVVSKISIRIVFFSVITAFVRVLFPV